MVKTPEQYFQEQDFHLPTPETGTSDVDFGQNIQGQGSNFTPAEQAFLQKYVGVEGAKSMGLDLSQVSEDLSSLVPDDAPLEDELKDLPSLQIIFFKVQGQTYTIPIEAVTEAIRYEPVVRLPRTPDFIAGVVNLRGRITPLIILEKLICQKSNSRFTKNSFIIVCQRKGMQFGMIVDHIDDMFFVDQKNISWNVESEIGASVECICGIIDHEQKVFGIVSVDKIINHVLESEGTI